MTIKILLILDPMKFSQIPGQKEIINRLLLTVSQERVSHAQLFTGPEGCGSLALALAYAQYISCEKRDPEDSCGTCKSCVKYEKMIHPDQHFVFPVVRNKKTSEPISTFEIIPLKPDLDGDGDVDLCDLYIFSDHWLQENDNPNWLQQADLHPDGRINMTDFACFSRAS